MNHFDLTDTLIIIGMIVFYIAFTSWLTLKLRSKFSAEFMEGSRALPAFIVGILLMT